MRTLPLPTGRAIPILGQGTWNMGEDPSARTRSEGPAMNGACDGVVSVVQ